jgi:hypothetical protein
MMQGALVLPLTSTGTMDASATRRSRTQVGTGALITWPAPTTSVSVSVTSRDMSFLRGGSRAVGHGMALGRPWRSAVTLTHAPRWPPGLL